MHFFLLQKNCRKLYKKILKKNFFKKSYTKKIFTFKRILIFVKNNIKKLRKHCFDNVFSFV